MGLTLPLLSASSFVRGQRASARIGALYAANTAGAVSGTLLTGFVLIGAVGIRRTFLAAAALNTVVGLIAIALDQRLARKSQDQEATPPHDVESERPSEGSLAPRSRVVCAVMAASGFASLALEVVWFRRMTQYALWDPNEIKGDVREVEPR